MDLKKKRDIEFLRREKGGIKIHSTVRDRVYRPGPALTANLLQPARETASKQRRERVSSSGKASPLDPAKIRPQRHVHFLAQVCLRGSVRRGADAYKPIGRILQESAHNARAAHGRLQAEGVSEGDCAAKPVLKGLAIGANGFSRDLRPGIAPGDGQTFFAEPGVRG